MPSNENPKQIKSRQRVADHGEVFTNPREVNAMLDLVRDESFRLDSRFLEPACGDGNFLIEILRRKLSLLKDVKSQTEWEFKSLIAVHHTLKHVFSDSWYSCVKIRKMLCVAFTNSFPLQDFSHPWTDEMLYQKYGLDKDEIAFIESMIRPMNS